MLRFDLGVLQLQRLGRSDAVEVGFILLVLPVLFDSGPVAVGLEQQGVGALSDLEESVVSPGGAPRVADDPLVSEFRVFSPADDADVVVDFLSCVLKDLLGVVGAGVDWVGVNAASDRTVLGDLELHGGDVVSVRSSINAQSSPSVDGEYVVRVRDVAALSGVAVLANDGV